MGEFLCLVLVLAYIVCLLCIMVLVSHKCIHFFRILITTIMEITSNVSKEETEDGMVTLTMDMDLEMIVDWQGTMPLTIIVPSQSKIRVLLNMPDFQRGMTMIMIWPVTWLSLGKNPKPWFHLSKWISNISSLLR